MQAQPILLEEGWEKLKKGAVQKIESILEDMRDGVYQNRITTDEYSDLYTYAPKLHTQGLRVEVYASKLSRLNAGRCTRCVPKSLRTTGVSTFTTTTLRQ